MIGMPGRFDPFMAKWNAQGSLIMIGFTNSASSKHELCIFDIGLNLIKIQLPNGDMIDSVHSNNLIGYTRFFIANKLLANMLESSVQNFYHVPTTKRL